MSWSDDWRLIFEERLVQFPKMKRELKEMSKTKENVEDPSHQRDNVIEAEFPDYDAPIISPEVEAEINKLYSDHPYLKQKLINEPEAVWIQTYSGRRFSPINPVVDAIVIQDIAHALSMQCRFSGHCREFYSVAQHSVFVSYICDSADAMSGLMHDASEAYLADFPSPLKHSGKFDAYLDFEANMQKAICQRFNLPELEPPSVKVADKILLATEARDLMSPLHPDLVQPCEPLPFKIIPLSPKDAKDLFMKRFYELSLLR